MIRPLGDERPDQFELFENQSRQRIKWRREPPSSLILRQQILENL
jgi:hypothetical protein